MPQPTNALAPTPANSLLDIINPVSIYRRNVEAPKRVYGESLAKAAMGRTDIPITESDFTPQELDALTQLVNENYQKKQAYFSRPKKELLADAAEMEKEAQVKAQMEKADPKNIGALGLTSSGLLSQAKLLRQAAEGKLPDDFSFGYEHFMDAQTPTQGVNWRDTIGRFRYKVDPQSNTFKVYDTYEFSNKSREDAIKRYAEMNPLQRFKTAMGEFLSGKEAALGEAYLGADKGVPTNINLNRPK